ncbi:outer membrane protein assembly factor BamB family protein [Halopelagius longus]|uniref:Outer membrane protein assembly factor BamB, contains PQQ-like beta-propeller repeat n=1 Tax=Halopelagius longus TaxID=1236180 RepID=A0A1H1G088_9EURY|nr:PQQ-binding-like beta-propeller repeat protein [Halopelagius longus]RDI69922.1 hypothetical protein DWB78_17405 [Halopelagius longus]SDR06583.1 Outer membrane protein assembly factor BamB, contains PQQ-like beta-propeller repeat [Halopelagius longus]
MRHNPADRTDETTGSESASGSRRRTVSRRRALSGIAALGSLAVAGCLSVPRIGGVEPQWRREFPDASAASPLTVSGNRVLVGAQDKALYGLDAEDGTTALRYETGGPIEARPAASGDGGPYHVHSTDGDVYTVDTDGQLLWREEGPHRRGTVASNGSLLAHLDAATDTVRGFDARSGDGRFERAIAGYRLTGLLEGTFVFREEVSGDRTRLVALATGDGSPRWQTEVRAQYPSFAVDERIAVSARESTVRAYDTRTGAVVWRSTVDGVRSYRAPTLGRHAYLRNRRPDSDDELLALDRQTGSVAWRNTAGYDIQRVESTDDAVFVGSRVDDPDGGILGRIDRFDLDGTRRWSSVTDAPEVGELVVTGDSVVLSGGRQAVVLARATGTERWSHEPESASRLSLTATDGQLYVSYLDDGAVARFPTS